jgi:3-hydroxyisobutyrate dehydrogenase-like beta-hydroxyacid dehydrogenase
MGATLGAEAAGNVLWAGEGRSAVTRNRAIEAALEDAGTVTDLVRRSEMIISICPPHAAVEVANSVATLGFTGTYLDANAVSPATVRRIAERFDRFVDGGIVGPPPHRAGTTRLWVAGESSPEVGAVFAGSRLEVREIDGPVGSASALKACFAAWTKGTSALLLAIAALAEAEGISGDLLFEWEDSIPALPDRLESAAARGGPKAWRFSGEMEEIAAAFRTAGLPDGFHLAAAEVFRRLAPLKDPDTGPTIDDAVELLLGDARDEGGGLVKRPSPGDP